MSALCNALQGREEQVVAMEAHMQHFVNTWRSDDNEDSVHLDLFKHVLSRLASGLIL